MRTIECALTSGMLMLLSIPASENWAVLASNGAQVKNAETRRAAGNRDVRDMAPGASVEGELAGGDEHLYRIALKAGQHIAFRIVKNGMDITPTLKAPSGKVLFSDSFETREHGEEGVLLVAEAAGAYILSVVPALNGSPPGNYEVRVDGLREATEQDRRRFQAQQAFSEANHLFNQETADARGEALKKLTQSLDIWRSVGDRASEAKILHVMGWTNYWLANYDGALENLTRALDLKRAVGDKVGEAETLCAIGSVYIYKEENQSAIEHLNKALTLQRASSERRGLADTLYELGRVHTNQSETERVADYYTQALQRYREVGDRANEASVLASLALMQSVYGDFQSALNNSTAALALFRAENIRYGEAAALFRLAGTYDNLGEPHRALDYYIHSLTMSRELGDAYAEAYVLTAMGGIYSGLGDQEKALALLKKALPLTRRVQDRRGEAGTLRYIGKVYQKMGNRARALEVLTETLKLSRELSDTYNEAGALTAIGELYASMRNHQKAVEHLGLALPLRRTAADRRGEAIALYALAGVERDRGNLREALQHAEETIEIIESLRAKVVGRELRTSYLAAQRGAYELYIDLLMSLNEQVPGGGYDAFALQVGERARARSLLDSLVEAGAGIRQGVDSSLLERDRSLARQLNAKEERRIRLLSGKHTSEQAAEANRDVDALLTEYRQSQSEIRAASPRYASLTQPQPLALREIQAQLDDETLLLFYTLGERRSFLWAVAPDSIKSYTLPSRQQIENDARWSYNLFQVSARRKSRAQSEVAADRLSRTLLSPVAAELDRKRLVIVSDGALQYIPFAALSVPGSRRPLIAEHEIVNLTSVSTLAQQRRELTGRKSAPKALAVIADPVFEARDERFTAISRTTARLKLTPPNRGDLLSALTTSAREAGLLSFRRLTFSRQEADQISEYISPESRSQFLDFDASRATLAQTDLSQYRILHFSTHGLLNSKNPELSGIVLSLYDKEGRPQDGFLRAHEIYNLKLGADLVVLSACQTALGKEVRSEGLIGLARGFMYAGAPRLVLSLWKVNDQATAELMKRFYKAMVTENLRPAAALRAAQSSMAREPRWSAPYYWAGFILQGEWR